MKLALRVLVATGAVASLMCLESAPPAQAQKALDKVSMRFGYVATGIDVTWAYGKQLGIFAKHGIDVEFREGKGSAVTAQTVAAGSDDFGVDIDGGTFLALASKGLPATAVLATVAKSPLAVISPADKPIKAPTDAIGKQLAITSGDGPSNLFKVLLARNKIDDSKVTLVNMQPGPKLTVLLTGRVDGVVTNVVTKAIVEGKGMPTHAMMFADFGLVTPGQYLIVSNQTLRTKPDLVRRMVAAAQESMQATVTDPQKAVEAFGNEYPNYDKATALKEIDIILSLMRSDTMKNAPLGMVSKEDAKAGQAALIESGMMEAGPDLDKFLTNEFVPH